EGPLDIDRRKVGHIGRYERGPRVAPSMADRGPWQHIGILAFDQVGPEALERPAYGSGPEQEPVIRTAGHARRSDGHGHRAVFLDHVVARAGYNHQMPVRRRSEDVPPFVQKIRAHAAAALGPA